MMLSSKTFIPQGEPGVPIRVSNKDPSDDTSGREKLNAGAVMNASMQLLNNNLADTTRALFTQLVIHLYYMSLLGSALYSTE